MFPAVRACACSAQSELVVRGAVDFAIGVDVFLLQDTASTSAYKEHVLEGEKDITYRQERRENRLSVELPDVVENRDLRWFSREARRAQCDAARMLCLRPEDTES